MRTNPAVPWPVLNFAAMGESLLTLQILTQIVGKIRLINTPWLNHSWHVTLYITARGLSTGPVPFSGGIFELEFDLTRHSLNLTLSSGQHEEVGLYSRPVASFYAELMAKLHAHRIPADIHLRPNELDEVIPFDQDDIHKVYKEAQIHTFWQVLVRVNTVLLEFRSRFTGKCSPVHFFWGAADLAVTRFSGRRAPEYTGAVLNIPLKIMREAYSHEVCSAGFWPGSKASPVPVFYAYCYPGSPAFGEQKVVPEQAFFSPEMGEFILPYEYVRTSADPRTTLLNFLQSTYQAAAETQNWDRSNLDFKPFLP